MVKTFNEENEVDPDNLVTQTISVSKRGDKADKKKEKEKLKEVNTKLILYFDTFLINLKI